MIWCDNAFEYSCAYNIMFSINFICFILASISCDHGFIGRRGRNYVKWCPLRDRCILKRHACHRCGYNSDDGDSRCCK